MATRRRRRPKVDARLADIVVAMRLHALLPERTQKAVTRLRKGGADRDAVLAEALYAVLPPDVLPQLLKADGLEVRGDWGGVYSGVDQTLRLVDSMIETAGLGRTPAGVAMMWRLAFFELAVRIGAASFARSPTETPELRHDMWSARRGYRCFLDGLLTTYGARLNDVLAAIEHRRLKRDAKKSLVERWYYEGRTPHANSIRAFAEGIAVALSREGDAALVAELRVRMHLFVGSRRAHGIVGTILGRERASALALAFSKQVHSTVVVLRRSANAAPIGAYGPVPPDKWLDERRRFARHAAYYGIRPASPGGWLLSDTKDADLGMLSWPPTSVLFQAPETLFGELMAQRHPRYVAARQGLLALVRDLSVDDCVADASEPHRDRQPLGLFGLLERV